MRLEDITTKEQAAYYLVLAQRQLYEAEQKCQAIGKRLMEIEQKESQSVAPNDAGDSE